jgi:hypothetical protein
MDSSDKNEQPQVSLLTTEYVQSSTSAELVLPMVLDHSYPPHTNLSSQWPRRPRSRPKQPHYKFQRKEHKSPTCSVSNVAEVPSLSACPSDMSTQTLPTVLYTDTHHLQPEIVFLRVVTEDAIAMRSNQPFPPTPCTPTTWRSLNTSTTTNIAMSCGGGDTQDNYGREKDDTLFKPAHSSAVSVGSVNITGSRVDPPAAVISSERHHGGDKLHRVQVILGSTLDTPEGHTVNSLGFGNKPRSSKLGTKQINVKSGSKRDKTKSGTMQNKLGVGSKQDCSNSGSTTPCQPDLCPAHLCPGHCQDCLCP